MNKGRGLYRLKPQHAKEYLDGRMQDDPRVKVATYVNHGKTYPAKTLSKAERAERDRLIAEKRAKDEAERLERDRLRAETLDAVPA